MLLKNKILYVKFWNFKIKISLLVCKGCYRVTFQVNVNEKMRRFFFFLIFLIDNHLLNLSPKKEINV